jgi:signal transduction histidine kinase
LIDESRKHSGVSCLLHLMEKAVYLNEDQTVAIFRIVQESLTNVTRHAKASHVEVTLALNADNLIVEVRDDGKGFDSADAARKKSFGLLGMRERAAVLEGGINISSAPRQGTVVRVHIPIKRNEEIIRDRSAIYATPYIASAMI